MITSQGDVAIVSPRRVPALPCLLKLPNDDFKRIQQLVSSTKPSTWKSNYTSPNSPCNDVFYYQ